MITSPDTKTWTAAIDRRLRAIVTHWFQVERAGSDGGGNQQQNKFDASTESVEATHAWLPIGPSCC